MRHVLDTTYRGHEVCLFADDTTDTYSIDVRADTDDGPMIAGWHHITTPITATAIAYAYIDRIEDAKGVGATTPEGRPLTAVTRYACFTCGTSKVRHYQTYEWVHALGDSLCDDVANPMPITTPVPRDAS